MAVKIRLARFGKKNYSYYHIVVTDSRSPRDSHYIESIGSYNPNINPAQIVLDGEKALKWLNNGAQPTDTCRRILSYEGVLLKKHLEGGVKKGAITEAVAEQRWNAWKAEKDAKLAAKKQNISNAKSSNAKELLAAEAKVNEERAEAIAKRKAEEALKLEEEKKAAEAEAAAQAAEAAAAEEAPAEATEPTPEA